MNFSAPTARPAGGRVFRLDVQRYVLAALV
jgi:hypothetical protein